jgi:Recombinase
MSADAIERIRRERAAGTSLTAIANGLNADAIPTAQGGRRWYPATVRHTLNRTP